MKTIIAAITATIFIALAPAGARASYEGCPGGEVSMFKFAHKGPDAGKFVKVPAARESAAAREAEMERFVHKGPGAGRTVPAGRTPGEGAGCIYVCKNTEGIMGACGHEGCDGNCVH